MAIGDLLAQISGDDPSTAQSSPLPPPRPSLPKRKAEDRLSGPAEKLPRKIPAQINRPLSLAKKPSLNPSGAKLREQTSVMSPKSVMSTSTVRSPAPAAPQPTRHDPSKGPPKKGSFAEIMARAKVVQSTLSQVGKIQHKRVEKMPNKRDRVDGKNQAQRPGAAGAPHSKGAGLRRGATPDRAGSRPNPSKPSKVASHDKVIEKKVKKAATATTGYTGTARPHPGASKAAPKSYESTSNRGYGRSRRDDSEDDYPSRRHQWASGDEDEDEDEDRYASDMSSDMEADAFELDEEERKAERAARQEDDEALREEMAHKRLKEEKRRKLAALAGRR